MTDTECVAFLQAALPQLGLHWPGFRKVRGLVCKRLNRRMRELGLPDLDAYRAHLENHAAEWPMLDGFCRIPISRFYRDRGVFESLELEVLPALAESAVARGRNELTCWSACCASGEEPYTLAVLWKLRLQYRFPQLGLRMVATDIDERVLERAREGCYATSSLKALPPELFSEAFERRGTRFCLRDAFRVVEFLQQDIRQAVPNGEFDLILCRNAVLTYFAPAGRRQVMERVVARLRPGGALVIGIHESLPEGLRGPAPWPGARAIYCKRESEAA
ncbi:MAG: methyltransferase domain-containing protein, partial [Betaproteobacteria bacterium]|nr:methyltransferase domain-containing protein [Betaproteobacteria bacterium]